MTGYLVDLWSDYEIDVEDNDFVLEFEREKNNYKDIGEDLNVTDIIDIVSSLNVDGIVYEKRLEPEELHAMDILLRLLKKQGKLLYDIETPEFGGFICNIRVTCNEVFN